MYSGGKAISGGDFSVSVDEALNVTMNRK